MWDDRCVIQTWVQTFEAIRCTSLAMFSSHPWVPAYMCAMCIHCVCVFTKDCVDKVYDDYRVSVFFIIHACLCWIFEQTNLCTFVLICDSKRIGRLSVFFQKGVCVCVCLYSFARGRVMLHSCLHSHFAFLEMLIPHEGNIRVCVSRSRKPTFSLREQLRKEMERGREAWWKTCIFHLTFK